MSPVIPTVLRPFVPLSLWTSLGLNTGDKIATQHGIEKEIFNDALLREKILPVSLKV